MFDFDAFVKAVVEGAKQLAKDTLQQGVKQAGEDAEAFLRRAENKMRRWTVLLAKGELEADEFAFLVRSQADLAELFALTQLGIGLARLQEFRNKLIDLVIDKAMGMIG